jgi:hypothetical protein
VLERRILGLMPGWMLEPVLTFVRGMSGFDVHACGGCGHVFELGELRAYCVEVAPDRRSLVFRLLCAADEVAHRPVGLEVEQVH